MGSYLDVRHFDVLETGLQFAFSSSINNPGFKGDKPTVLGTYLALYVVLKFTMSTLKAL